MQEDLYSHFKSEGHNNFLGDMSITFNTLTPYEILKRTAMSTGGKSLYIGLCGLDIGQQFRTKL